MYIAKEKNVKFKACDFRKEMKVIVNMTNYYFEESFHHG
jgi:hypothetical protein